MKGPREPIPWRAWPILWRPDRVRDSLERIEAAGLVESCPTVWQVALGVVRMLHRIVFRSDTIGLSPHQPARRSLRSRLLQNRGVRLPFLIWERAIAPFDLSGLVSTPERLKRHLIGAHHDGDQCLYDREILASAPGALEELEEEVSRIVDGTHPRATWLRDLTVFEGYHEGLLERVRRVRAGESGLSAEQRADPDITFEGFLRWCAAQPSTPRETLAAWRAGALPRPVIQAPQETP